MPCTTILVGKNASNDGSTMIARTDDSMFGVKKAVIVPPEKQPKLYKSVISHVEIPLPADPMQYTACPNVDKNEGIWAASGINAANVGMTATETITSNPRVLAADPLVEYRKAARGEKEVIGGIGEEDMVVLVLPYIHSAREGVLRLGALLEQYGTYESNGIGFNDADEVWWLETIGGHHWMARRVRDNECVINPNQFGMDAFDFDDACGAKQENLCSEDLRSFLEENRLDLNNGGAFNPRFAFGSRRDADHVYNTPRAWFMARYLQPFTHKWDGPDAEYTPESDNLPWSLVPDKKVAVEDVKYLLSSHYQGTPYDPYSDKDPRSGMYRPIGINRTGVTVLCQIRGNEPEVCRGVVWIAFGSAAFSAFLPMYANVPSMPKYLSSVTMEPSTENFYWASRLIGALADPCRSTCIQHIERYHEKMFTESRKLLVEYDRRMKETPDAALPAEANGKLAAMAKSVTSDTLNKVLGESSRSMKNGYRRADR